MTDLRSLRQRRSGVETDSRAINFDSLRRVQEQAGPIFVQLAAVLEKVEPVITQITGCANTVWIALQPYHPLELFPALYGFFLVFFGGIFMTLVASLEAAHQFGWNNIKYSLIDLNQEWKVARIAFERDNKVDKDRDGIADVNELTTSELASRRLMVLTSSIDPQKVSNAIEGLTVAIVAILATLRIRFAKAITLGTAIGQVLENLLSPFTTKALKLGLPNNYDNWIPVINKYGFRYIGVSASWVLMRIITSVFAAMKGSELFLTGLISYLERHQYLHVGIFKEGNPIVVATWGILAMMGIYAQMSSRFSLPFPLNLMLLPLSIAEQVVIFAVGTTST